MTTYYRYEIALQYFPESSPETALKKLNRWIKGNQKLTDALEELSYRARGKTFTKAQIDLIYHYLGEP